MLGSLTLGLGPNGRGHYDLQSSLSPVARSLPRLSRATITDTKVIVVKRSMLMVVASRDTAVSRELMALTACELRRAQNHVLLLVKSAEQRVAHFLLEMAERARGGNSGARPVHQKPGRHKRMCCPLV
jgi:CRP-like cAMP-binding protein